MITASAPGKILLFGEHAVVYDKLGIAAAIDKRIGVSAYKGGTAVELQQPFHFPTLRKTQDEIEELHAQFRLLFEQKQFDKIKELGFHNAIYVLLGEIFSKHGYSNLIARAHLSHTLKGIGASASLFSALSAATLKVLGVEATLKEISDFSYIGDVVAHGGTPSGIDNSIATFGGFLSFRKSEGPKPLKLDLNAKIIVIDTGEKSSTAELVSNVRALREKEPEKVNKIMDEIDSISNEALAKIKNRDIVALGNLMDRNHTLLKSLGCGLSTERIEKIVSMAKENGAYGAKLSGAGGGGICIALTDNPKKILNSLKNAGFYCFETNLGAHGVSIDETGF